MPIDIKPIDKIVIDGLIAEPSNWSIIARHTKYKYRNLLKQESQNDELTNHLRETFKESADELKELDTWLFGVGCDREVIPNKKSQMSESGFASMFSDVNSR